MKWLININEVKNSWILMKLRLMNINEVKNTWILTTFIAQYSSLSRRTQAPPSLWVAITSWTRALLLTVWSVKSRLTSCYGYVVIRSVNEIDNRLIILFLKC